jgi:tetratricopeptide (TPR) repeat protein
MTRPTLAAVAIAVLVAGWCGGAAAAPGPATTVDHYQVGKWLFERKRYAEAIEEFRVALSIAPRPAVLYSLAQAQRMLGDCTSAIDSYRAFLAGKPEAPLDDYARANIERCQQAGRARREPSPWYRDAVGDALVGGGLVAGVVGALVWRSGRSAAAALADASDYQRFVERQPAASSALTKQRLGVAAMIAGGAAVIGGVVHFAVSARTPRGDAVAGAGAGIDIAVLGGGGIAIAGHGRF